jgi:hypothetical protein
VVVLVVGALTDCRPLELWPPLVDAVPVDDVPVDDVPVVDVPVVDVVAVALLAALLVLWLAAAAALVEPFPGWILATATENTPTTPTPAAATHRVREETRRRP